MSNRDYDIVFGAKFDKTNHINNIGELLQSGGCYLGSNGGMFWYNKEGQYHREDGPAIINEDGAAALWCLNDKEYTFDDWCIELNKSDEEKMLLRLQYG